MLSQFLYIKMYWTPAEMPLLADVDEYNFANADIESANFVNIGPGYVAHSAPSHYLKQCWFIVNNIIRNKFQRNLVGKCIWIYCLQNVFHFVQIDLSVSKSAAMRRYKSMKLF